MKRCVKDLPPSRGLDYTRHWNRRSLDITGMCFAGCQNNPHTQPESRGNGERNETDKNSCQMHAYKRCRGIKDAGGIHRTNRTEDALKRVTVINVITLAEAGTYAPLTSSSLEYS